MTYADMFSKVKGLFMESDVSDISEHLAFQFNITGEAEGIFYAEVKDGVLAGRMRIRLHGVLFSRHRTEAYRRFGVRRRTVHQSHPRPSRLSQDIRELPQRQEGFLRRSA